MAAGSLRVRAIGQDNSRACWYCPPYDIDFSDTEISNKQPDHHNELVYSPLYPNLDPASSGQARSEISTGQVANSDGDPSSSHPIPNSFDPNLEFDFEYLPDIEPYLDSKPHLPEFSETQTQLTIDPRILGISNTLDTGFEDGQLQQPLASSHPLPPTISPQQEYFSQVPLRNSNPPQPKTMSRSGTDHRYHVQGGPPRVPSPPVAQNSSFARLSESTSSLSQATSSAVSSNQLLPELAAPSPDGFHLNRSDRSKLCTATKGRRIRPRILPCPWPGCQYVCALKKDLKRHHITHVKPDRANYSLCPNHGCTQSFPRADNCQRHARKSCQWK